MLFRLINGAVIVLLLILVVVLAGALYWLVDTREPSVEPFRPDAPTYAERGEYTVGVQSFTIRGEGRPLNVWVWYPTDGEQELANYSEFMGVFETSGRANWDAEPLISENPYPLVVYSHGSGSSPLLSLFFTEHLASQGFVVIATEHPGNTMVDRLLPSYDRTTVEAYANRPQDVTRVIDFALDDLNALDGALDGLINPDQIAVAGHSFGGWTTFAAAGASINFDAMAEWCASEGQTQLTEVRPAIGIPSIYEDVRLGDLPCGLLDDAEAIADARGFETVPNGQWESVGDERVSAVVALAPWNFPIFGEESLSAVDVPTLIIVGGNDNTTHPERDARNFYSSISSEDKTLVEFVLADHSIFVDVCPPLLISANAFDACSDPIWSLPRAHDLTNHIVTSFLLDQFNNDSDASDAFNNIDFAGVRVERP